MRLQTKVFVTTALIFLTHFAVNTYIGQRQIEAEVIANIKDNARTIRGMLESYRGVYQKIFLNHNIPINDKTIEFLPAHAISRISRDFTQWVDNGLTFNNVSDHPRNSNNKADTIELEAIDFFRNNDEITERFVPYTNESGESFYHFSQPIIIKPRCMKCHGKKEDAPESIQKRYNTSYNYNIGDLRGLMSIKLPAQIIQQRTSELLVRNIIIHLLGLIISFILLALLLNRTVLSRIKSLQAGSEKLAAGDYNTQIELKGHDELTTMGHSFNHMSQTIYKREQELTELNDLMRMLLESTGEGIFGVDRSGTCTFVNHAAQEMFGYSLAELKGQSMHQLTHHSRKDGSYFPSEECSIYNAFVTGIPSCVDNEVFWRKDGTSFPVQYSAYPIRDDKQNIKGSVTLFRDVTESLAMTKKMNYMSSHDSLTSLLNRYSFEQRLTFALKSAKFEGIQHVVCYLDLDQFKVVNDTCGHLAGDEMLKLIAQLLQNSVRSNDTLARLGGDEFGLLLENCPLEHAQDIAHQICKSIKDFRFTWDEKIFSVSCSIGLSAISEDTQSVQSIMSTIDASCYIAKDKGRNQIHISSDNDSETARHQDEMHWVSEVRKALEEDRFVLYQQTILPSDPLDQENQHFEILLRMQDSENNIVPPGAFLPAAEHYGLIADLDRWVIHTTFKWLASQIKKNKKIDFCSINLSGQSIGDEKLYQFIMEQQQEFQINPELICFEVTENAAVKHLNNAINFIQQLREHGFLFALDDFGTGMSSFEYLKNLPVDFLKIDGSFVKDIIDDPIDRAMVKSINEIGHIMGLKTIAEYVENAEIQAELTLLKVDYLQGYGIAKPVPCEE
ncbi:MAG: EAL domain-containing protein [Gammaproteobacteria bacterium]|nr:EAL domain-containing protein [Gammaproteobacteria bacterium]